MKSLDKNDYLIVSYSRDYKDMYGFGKYKGEFYVVDCPTFNLYERVY